MNPVNQDQTVSMNKSNTKDSFSIAAWLNAIEKPTKVIAIILEL